MTSRACFVLSVADLAAERAFYRDVVGLGEPVMNSKTASTNIATARRLRMERAGNMADSFMAVPLSAVQR